MGLDKQVSLDVGVVVLGLGGLEGHSGPQLSEERVLLVAYGQALVLGCRGEDLQQTPQLRLAVE